MDDNISRQAAIEEIQPFGEYESNRTNKEWVRLCTIILKQLPSTDRKGHWIDIDSETYTWKVRCNKCGHERSMMSTQGVYPNFCENCGALMEGEDSE